MKTTNFLAHAGVIVFVGLLLSQCLPTGSPQSAATATPAPPEKESLLKVTLLQPAPIRLDPAQVKQLGTAREVVERKPETAGHHKKTSQSGLLDSLQEMHRRDLELAPFRKMKQGVKLRMRLTNTGKNPLTIRYGPDTGCMVLTVRGRGALNLPCDGLMTADLRIGRPVTLAPAGSKEFVITELRHGSRDLNRWLITRPGDYEISASFSTMAIVGNAGEAAAREEDARTFDFSLKGYEAVGATSNPVTLKVTE